MLFKVAVLVDMPGGRRSRRFYAAEAVLESAARRQVWHQASKVGLVVADSARAEAVESPWFVFEGD